MVGFEARQPSDLHRALHWTACKAQWRHVATSTDNIGALSVHVSNVNEHRLNETYGAAFGSIIGKLAMPQTLPQAAAVWRLATVSTAGRPTQYAIRLLYHKKGFLVR